MSISVLRTCIRCIEQSHLSRINTISRATCSVKRRRHFYIVVPAGTVSTRDSAKSQRCRKWENVWTLVKLHTLVEIMRILLYKYKNIYNVLGTAAFAFIHFFHLTSKIWLWYICRDTCTTYIYMLHIWQMIAIYIWLICIHIYIYILCTVVLFY